MKQQHRIKLIGQVKEGDKHRPAKHHEANKIDLYSGTGKHGFITHAVCRIEGKQIILAGKSDDRDEPWSCRVKYNPKKRIYHVIVDDVKLHIKIRNITGKLVYWK